MYTLQEYYEDCGAPTVVTLRESTRRATKDMPLDRIKKGDVYDEWVGLVDDEFTVDRISHRDKYEGI